MSKGSQASRQ